MVVEHYSWRNCSLVKHDSEGNIISGSLHVEPVEHKESPVPSISTNQSISVMMEDQPEPKSTITNTALSTIHENTSSDAQSPEKSQFPEKHILTKEDLAKRDSEAVAYSKALLVEGDTLVYITYPGDSKCFDSTGFEISAAPHRVHSSRLLATGSKIFAKLLSSTSQYRIVRRKKLVGNLPLGIKYVLDLTPPDEGDEAVELTSELSCSLGIRLWYTAAQRCGISHNLVGGEDEIMDARKIASYGSPTAGGLLNHQEVDIGASQPDQAASPNLANATWTNPETARQNRDIAKAVRISLEELSMSKVKKAGINDPLDVREYCPIRHRAGIGRLLRVLEGKDPRLDSAPKVWTLFVLAKYFDCTAAVVDWIVSWVIADPNTQFIEILPEASCKMAFGLKNQMICRGAFAILVSEEALSLASRETGRMDADRRGTNQFGRVREDIDEDLRTRIEYASKSFASRVCQTYEALAEEGMTWVTQLQEYQKLQRFKKVVLSYMDKIDQAPKWLSAIDVLEVELRTYVRSRILSSLSASLAPEQADAANYRRHAEKYLKVDALNKSDGIFSQLYEKLLDKERIFTRFFWLFLLYIDFPMWFHGERPSDSDPRIMAAYLSGVRPSVLTLLNSQKRLNESILEAIEMGLFHDGIMPPEALQGHTQTYTSRTPQTAKESVDVTTGILNSPEARSTVKSWNPFSVFKFEPGPPNTPRTGGNDWNASPSGENWKDDWNKSTTEVDWDAWTTNYGSDDTQPLVPEKAGGLSNIIQDVRRSTGSANWDTMDVDEYLAQHHLLDPASGLEKATTSEQGFSATKSYLPLRPKPNPAIPLAEDFGSPGPYIKKGVTAPATDSPQQGVDKVHTWTLDEPTSSGQARGNKQSRWNAEAHLNLVLRQSQNLLRTVPKPSVPGDDKIQSWSPFLNMSRFFLEAKDHIRDIAAAMLDQREMGFDVTLTDTLLCLGPEEFKYLPLWAGGDDDDSGGVFDDTIPVALAGPNGPGPGYHTGFSSASAASSEFDTMSDRTAFNTSVAVEDGYSDHIDRRLVVTDDDFHSETFSEDSEVYNKKGKSVDRSGFYTSAPTSEAAFSLADTTTDSVPDIATPDDDSSFEMEYVEQDSDADTTVGQVNDEDEDEVWDGGDNESFDFGDSDEEMANI